MTTKIPYETAKRRLAKLWLVLGGVLAAFVILQGVGGKFGAAFDDVMRWFMPTLAPTMTLILGVVAFDAGRETASGVARQVDRFYYRIAWWLSVLYIGAIWAVFLAPTAAHMIAAIDRIDYVATIKRTDYWLPILQSFVATSIGIFFVKKSE